MSSRGRSFISARSSASAGSSDFRRVGTVFGWCFRAERQCQHQQRRCQQDGEPSPARDPFAHLVGHWRPGRLQQRRRHGARSGRFLPGTDRHTHGGERRDRILAAREVVVRVVHRRHRQDAGLGRHHDELESLHAGETSRHRLHFLARALGVRAGARRPRHFRCRPQRDIPLAAHRDLDVHRFVGARGGRRDLPLELQVDARGTGKTGGCPAAGSGSTVSERAGLDTV